MRLFSLTSFLVASAHALPELSITKRDSNLQASKVARGVVKRDTISTNVFGILTWSNGGGYYANVTVGTPPQNQVVILDTGSSDLYFDSSSAPACQTTGPRSCKGGTFDLTESNTYSEVAPSPAFNTTFGDGSTASGPFGQDVLGIGDVAISNVQFGVAMDTESTVGYNIGLLGIGYSFNEATSVKYPNVPEVLATTGEINSRLYSIYLNSVDEVTGTIIFGGIDTTKFTGPLVTVDLLPNPRAGFIFQFISTVTGLAVRTQGETDNVFFGGPSGIEAFDDRALSLPVLLDTGSAAWTVPQSYFNEVIQPNFPFIDEDGLVACSHRDDESSITLEFSHAINITVPAREFIVPIYNSTTNEPIRYDKKNDACAFMITPGSSQGSGYLTLGDAILRSMYVVFDLDNGQISIAQAASNSTAAPNILRVPAGPSGVASALSSASATASYLSASRTYSVAPVVSTSVAHSVSSLSTTIGAATGTNAIETDAVPSESASGSASHLSPLGPIDIKAMAWYTGLGVFMAGFGVVIMV